MQKRSTDNGEISEAQIRKSRKGAFDWVTLFLTNWTATKGLLTLLTLALGAGTATNPVVYKQLGFASQSLPVPKGQVVTPDPDATGTAYRAQLTQSINSMTDAIDQNTASVDFLRNDLNAVEERLQGQINEIKKLVN